MVSLVQEDSFRLRLRVCELRLGAFAYGYRLAPLLSYRGTCCVFRHSIHRASQQNFISTIKKKIYMTNKKYPRSFAHACAMTKKNPKTALPYAKPKNDFQEALNAVATLWIIAQAIRGTWEADYDNSNQKK